MDEVSLPDVTNGKLPVIGEDHPLELADRLGPDETRTLVTTVVRTLLAEDQREVWRRRRERLLHFLNLIEHNLDYDLRVRGLASENRR